MQPARGLRTAIDPVLLAAAVPAQAGEHILELGCGSGAAALCLAARVAGCRVSGIDVQAGLIALAHEGARASGLADRVAFFVGDLLDPPPELDAVRFDHAMLNPPHLRPGSGRISPDPAKRLASVEGAADLAAWLRFAVDHVAAQSTVTVIHRAERAGEVAALLAAAGADAIVFPLWPKRPGVGAKRAIIQGRLGGGGHVRHGDGLVLHRADGAFTPETESILRHAAALAL